MEECITQRATLLAQIPKIKARRQQLGSEWQSAISGSLSFKTFFKSGNEKKTYANQIKKQIDELDEDEKSCHNLGLYLDSYICQMSFQFKLEKIDDYAHIVREMSSVNIDNSNNSASYYSKLLSDPKMTAVKD